MYRDDTLYDNEPNYMEPRYEELYENDEKSFKERDEATAPEAEAEAAGRGGGGGPENTGYTVYVTDIYNDSTAPEGQREQHYEYHIQDIKEVSRFDVEGGMHLEDHRTITVLDNETDQFIKTIDIDFREDGIVELRAETERLESGGRTEIIDHYNEDGKLERRETNGVDADGKMEGHGETLFKTDGSVGYFTFDNYNQDGSVDHRLDVATSEDGSKHELNTYYDDKGEVTYQKASEINNDGYPTAVQESFSPERNALPVDTTDTVDHIEEHTERDGHSYTEIYDTRWVGSETEGYEVRSNVLSVNEFVDADGKEIRIEIFERSPDEVRGLFKQTENNPETGRREIFEGYAAVTTPEYTENIDINKETIEQYRDDGTIVSRKDIYYGDNGRPCIEVNTTYDSSGEKVEKTERVDYFFTEDEDMYEVIKKDIDYDEDGQPDRVSSETSIQEITEKDWDAMDTEDRADEIDRDEPEEDENDNIDHDDGDSRED